MPGFQRGVAARARLARRARQGQELLHAIPLGRSLCPAIYSATWHFRAPRVERCELFHKSLGFDLQAGPLTLQSSPDGADSVTFTILPAPHDGARPRAGVHMPKKVVIPSAGLAGLGRFLGPGVEAVWPSAFPALEAMATPHGEVTDAMVSGGEGISDGMRKALPGPTFTQASWAA